MSTQKLTNVTLSDFKKFLKKIGCEHTRTTGGHEIWEKEGLTRPLILQTHVTPIPQFIIQRLLHDLDMTKEDYFEVMSK